jgi:hypothetical protein
MLRPHVVGIFAVFCTINTVFAVPNEPISFHPAAPPELQHFAPLLGSWRTTEETLKSDGSGWSERPNADWHFYLAMNGWAIRDEYFSPALDIVIDDEKNRTIGSNLRVFDSSNGQWHMAWLNKSGSVSNMFTALSDSQQIVMLSAQANASGYYSRITFFAMTAESFEWKLEWSKDPQGGWFEVGRIHAKRQE